MNSNATILTVKNVSKAFTKGKVKALDSISCSLTNGKVLAIVGESGSGKTTLIRLIAGLEVLDSGEIYLKDNLVSSATSFINPEHRNVGMVFQDYALFPHFTVYKNIAFGISKHNNKKDRIGEVLKLVGLLGFEHRYPHELSGGQQQRVALARALAPEPEILLLDEPFSNLDVILRKQLREDVLRILKNANCTAIFVTHDIKDALAISDEIIVLKDGNLLQQGVTKEVFNNPKTPYIASLFKSVTY